MNIIINNYEVTLLDEPTYSPNSSDNVRSYDIEICRDEQYESISAHGLMVGDVGAPDSSVILWGVGGATGVNENSIAYHNNTCFVAAGDSVFSLSIPCPVRFPKYD